MNTENVKSIFRDYLKAENTNYAILLNGNWGSGKSFFWKNSLQKIVEENECKEIYISLNGISKIENLEHMLFIKLIPFIGKNESGLINNAITLVSNVGNKVSSHFLKTSISDIFKGVSVDAFNFSKYIICFDDLERCQIPVKEVLGFINNYVEHKNLKTIILADENEINNSQNDKSYHNIKEKLIGRIINFKLDIKETLPKLFIKHQIKNSSFYDFLVNYENYIAEILIEYEQQNLRTISFYLETLAKIHPLISDQNEKFKKEIILFSIIVTIEFKNGHVKSKDFDNFEEFAGFNRYSLFSRALSKIKTQKSETDVDETKTKKEIFTETYLKNRLEEYNFYPAIYSYILSGYLNEEDLKTYLINKYKSEFGTQEVIAFNKLINNKFRLLSDFDFDTLITEVKTNAEKGIYSLYEYVQLADFYYYFAENNLTTLSNSEIKNFIIIGLNECKKRKEINQSVYDNIFHFEEKNIVLGEIRNIVNDLHNEIKKEQDINESDELIKNIKNQEEKLIENFFQKFNCSIELFKYTDEQILFETIVNTENFIINKFTGLIGARYVAINIGETLYDDIHILKNLNQKFTEYLDNNIEKSLKRFLLKILNEKIKNITEHLENTKK